MELRPRGNGRLAALLLVPSAVLVAVLMLALRLHFQPLAVPQYRLETDAGAVEVLRPGGRVDLEATPQIEVQGAVTARAFLVSNGKAQPWKVPLEIGRDGSVHLVGPVDRLFADVPSGEWEIAIAVGRPELLPNDTRQLVVAPADTDGGQAAWRVVRQRVLLSR
jgi:hypothetical protein